MAWSVKPRVRKRLPRPHCLAVKLRGLRPFGDYQLLEQVARDGMGVVYQARQAGLNRIVALKMRLAGPWASPGSVHRFHTEAQAVASILIDAQQLALGVTTNGLVYS
jgi:serine/threonine protein kinase